ncbi:MAG: hypothetical protein AAF085_07555 [Planctomycetota bacterium]
MSDFVRHAQCLAGLIAVLLLCIAAHETEAAEATKPPNIIFIFADDLGFADLGCYGHLYAKTNLADKHPDTLESMSKTLRAWTSRLPTAYDKAAR